MASTTNGLTIHPDTVLAKAAEHIRIYDTARHGTVDFTPIVPGKVTMYVCGATVQSSPHIGHLRAGVAFDVIRRWLMKLGYEVVFVRNVTDIDDKILNRSAAEGQNWWARAHYYEDEFTDAYNALGVLAPTYEPRATGHITDMVSLVERLIDRGHAYITANADGTPSGNVYFDVPSWKEYGALTHQEGGVQTGEADEAARVADALGPSVDASGEDKYNPADAADQSEAKHDPRDFALWKASKDTDPSTARWETPFGTGRPGWHLECSAMSRRYLGDDFDIHGGGLDLRFPHHENEMAQSRAAGWGFAHHWMHSAWVTQKGEKMSKSLGNGLSVGSILSSHTPWVARYALATVQYRSMLEWSAQTLQEAESAYSRIMNFLEHAAAAAVRPTREEVLAVGADDLPESFTRAMNDDFSVSGAIAVIFSEIRRGNTLMASMASAAGISSQEGSESGAPGSLNSDLENTVLSVRAMLDVLGLDPLDPQWLPGGNSFAAAASFTGGRLPSMQEPSPVPSQAAYPSSPSSPSQAAQALDALVSAQLREREEARKSKDFTRADAIRDMLAEAGIIIEDTPHGPAWKL